MCFGRILVDLPPRAGVNKGGPQVGCVDVDHGPQPLERPCLFGLHGFFRDRHGVRVFALGAGVQRGVVRHVGGSGLEGAEVVCREELKRL